VPARLEDLVIYELHVGSLGFGQARPGNLADAVAFLDHLVDLGVNAVELLPLAEFSGIAAWGYGGTHHLCIESSAGGRDKYRHFVRECHRRGIAVIQDVVYNHYDGDAVRAEWQYDSAAPERNAYYWYEGRASDHATADGGYVDNGSSGWAPRYWEEVVRQQFISGAAFLIEEMHVDGLRVDLTQAMHRDNRLVADKRREVGNANVFGQKLLREWSRTLRMIRPTVMLIAEDHTGWDAVTKPAAQDGLGFDATWEVAFYHDLIGDSEMAGDAARLLRQAGHGGDEPLAMDRFSGALYGSHRNKVVFHESHDEAGNAKGTARTLVTAVNGAPLVGPTRVAAEARARVCFGLSLLSAGTPMFFMGEEIGARNLYQYDNFLGQRDDILGERAGNGRLLFRFYAELISLSRRLPSVRSRNIDIVHVSNDNRVLAFKRWSGGDEVLVVASLNNAAFASGYVIAKDQLAIPDGRWKEVFNSDAAAYGGGNVGNHGATLPSAGGRLDVVLPASGFVVLVRQ
jgi:1,4-alpha-glucan branching enzyme